MEVKRSPSLSALASSTSLANLVSLSGAMGSSVDLRDPSGGSGVDLSDYFSVENGIAKEREYVYGRFRPKLTFAYLPSHCIHRRSEGLLAFAAKQSEGGASKLSNVERFLKFGAEGHGEGKGGLLSVLGGWTYVSFPLFTFVLHDATPRFL